jgi:hypothetical protein
MIDPFQSDISLGVCSDTYLRSSAAWCGCTEVPEITCNLCADGSSPTDPFRKERVGLFLDCFTMEYVASFLNETTCPDLVPELLGFDAPAFW